MYRGRYHVFVSVFGCRKRRSRQANDAEMHSRAVHALTLSVTCDDSINNIFGNRMQYFANFHNSAPRLPPKIIHSAASPARRHLSRPKKLSPSRPSRRPPSHLPSRPLKPSAQAVSPGRPPSRHPSCPLRSIVALFNITKNMNVYSLNIY